MKPEPAADAVTRQYIDLAETTGGFIHDMKNHLGTVLLNLQLLEEDFEAAESQRERRAAERIKLTIGECRRLVDLSNDFLRFARIEELHSEPTDLREFLGRMIEFIGPTAKAANITINCYPAADLPPVSLDRDMMEKVLLNLMLNAEDAMPEGGTLTVQTRAEGNNAVIDVIDTGRGIEPDVLAKLFKPFFTTKPAGNGLGLATARKIVSAHGGTMTMQSEPGRGTKVTLRLPLT
jgi:two-component system, NtrC family, sensor histidine kinase HydH